MRNFWSFVLLTFLVLSITSIIASSGSSTLGTNISKEVMKYLSAFYEANSHEAEIQEKLKKYPEPKMIALLSDNSKYRQYLENTVYSWEKFTQQVLHIIDEENLSYWESGITTCFSP